jgi:hypothetical protein
MTDSALAIVLLIAFIPALYLARLFRTLDSRFWSWARAPILGGLAVAVILRLLPLTGPLRLITVGALLTITAAYARRIGDESEPIEGMALGAMTGAAAALPAVLVPSGGISAFAETLLSGTIAGLGITWASRYVNDKPRQIAIDLATGAGAIAGAALPRALVRAGLPGADVAVTIAVAILLVIVASVFSQWSDLKAELSHEASLGFIDDSQVRSSTHPILRLGRGGWIDRKARREYVRLANKLALRKRQQRFRPDETARLYQLEIIKLRMTLQELARVEHDVRHSAKRDDPALQAAVARRSE